ncbi:glycoside hydrolase [Zychaea mexicana]|uniref:glycoside hydrolase n=1 Tax=Zychaea mexicana TaxID=64656 RepID=UPI0022FDF9F4|nr:glycoside hydrolase [Zychaea mexicana]KAI9495104.1 glycoside hydrolase [Zychaea mexicana]
MPVRLSSVVGLVISTLLLVPGSHTAISPDEVEFISQADQAANASLLWGTYRPNLYFGTRPRLPESVMTGMMWFDASHLQGFQRARHACDQGDGIKGYGYHKHDGRRYGLQTINDGPSNIAITTEFVKIPGGEHGGNWGVRIHGVPMKDQVPSITSIIFYMGLEGEGSMDIVSKISKKGLESPVRLEGDTPDLGDFEFKIVDGPLNNVPGPGIQQDLSRTQWWGLQTPENEVWKAKDIIMPNLLLSARERLMQESNQQEALDKPYAYFTLKNELTEEEDEIANLYAFQKVFKGEFQFDILFESGSSPKKMTSEALGSELTRQREEFEARFENVFHLQRKGFSGKEVEFGQFLLSNLLGGMGYFHGSAVVDRSHPPMQDEESFDGAATKPEFTSPQSLFTATPSRPFFPRGFYWDEGFHQLVIGKWDNDLSLNIVKHWVSLIDDNGWIGREQILGDEARSKVPAEFQTQFPHYGNPPTLYLAISRYVQRLLSHEEHHQQNLGGAGQQTVRMGSIDDADLLRTMHLDNPTMASAWLESVYPKLKLNWQWFRTMQKGHIEGYGRQAPNNEEAYRWRGRTPEHTLTSGLDDYPRGEPPNVGELHADLLSWMAFATRMLKDISSHLGPEYADDVEEYTRIEKNMLDNLDALHWNEEQQAYCDQTMEEGKPVHVCHKGYATLMPFALGLLPADSPKLGATLDLIADEDELWSPYGLRSLSASDPKYRTGEVYWRGPIWMNINYLTLQSLHNNYINVPGPYQEQAQKIYTSLRKNIINNVYKDYRKTGYVWEQYDDRTGEGLRSHPFTGWTSLVLLIMAEEYT